MSEWPEGWTAHDERIRRVLIAGLGILAAGFLALLTWFVAETGTDGLLAIGGGAIGAALMRGGRR